MPNVGARLRGARRPDPLDVALREIDIAVDLVRSGRARVVELVGLPAAERAAGVGLAKAQAAGVRFSVQRSGPAAGAVSLRIGPSFDDQGPNDG
jgi:hypothetical protein